MRQLNARLTVVVAVVAVAAVAGGGVFAHRQAPQSNAAGANPLGGQPVATPTATPSATPPRTPSATPSVTPSTPPVTKPGMAGPQKVAITLADLPEGRTPQLTHTIGREVSGGPTQAYTMPGTARIIAAAQVDNATYVIESREPNLVLVRSEGQGDRTEVPNVTTLVASADATIAAYASQKQKSTGEQLPGSTVYAEGGGERRKLTLTDTRDIQVIAVADGKVFYSASTTRTGPSKLYSWVPGRSAATLIKGVTSPTAVSADGTLAGSIEAIGQAGSCSYLVQIATGKKLWRSCAHQLMGFTPDKSAVIAAPAYGDGYAPLSSWVLDGETGNVLREWTGMAFRQVRAEDDQHLLMEVDDGPDTKGAIIRCTIGTGECERATPITAGDRFGLGS